MLGIQDLWRKWYIPINIIILLYGMQLHPHCDAWVTSKKVFLQYIGIMLKLVLIMRQLLPLQKCVIPSFNLIN